jgi:hypothetical protein
MNFCSGERGLQWNIFFDNAVLRPSRGIYPWRPFIFLGEGATVLQQKDVRMHHILTRCFDPSVPAFSDELHIDKILK